MRRREDDLLDGLVEILRSRWPLRWSQPNLRLRPTTTKDRRYDAVLELGTSQTLPPVRMAVELKSKLSPSGARQVAAKLRDIEILVVSRWLSPRTREVLQEEGANYLDLTGNVFIALERPRLLIQTQGSDKDPEPKPASTRGLRGSRSWVLARTLSDVNPPYTLTDLTVATGLSPAFISRLLTGLEDEDIIRREPRGPVVDVDVGRLVKRWVQDYGLLRSNEYSSFVLADGPRAFERRLAAVAEDPWAITGSLGAVRIVPIAAPALAVAYVDRPREMAKRMGLLPSDVGANVILARPADPITYERRWSRDGIWYAAPAQLAADCLSGTGRMPNEGAEILNWMQQNPSAWRAPSLDAPTPLTSQNDVR